MKKLTKAQRRILQEITQEAEAEWSGMFARKEHRRGDINIARKLARRGYLVYEGRAHGYGWTWRLWPTAKGYAVLGDK